MGRDSPVLIAGVVGLLFQSGCASAPEREPSEVPSAYAMLPNGHDPMNPDRLSSVYVALAGSAQANAARVLERAKGRPLELLSLSGGGQGGAFGAGFLLGWRESGGRPRFDAVAGVSTGALLGTHALLGTPEDDAELEELCTRITRDDVYEARSLFALLFGTDSLMDTTPLRELIAEHITSETLERVAAAADDMRFFWVATTNVDYEQTWVWNMSQIAKDGKVELYRDVLLASASFPIVFPPVEIDGHLFVDGAVRSNVVVPGLAGPKRPGPPPYGPGNVYLIVNGKLEYPPDAPRRTLRDVATTTVNVMMNQSMQGAVLKTYVGTRQLGYDFHLVSIEPHVEIGNDPLVFDPEEMRTAFDAGRELGRQPDPWRTEHPSNNDLPVWTEEVINRP